MNAVIASQSESELSEGHKAPVFDLPGSDGKNIRLGDLRGKSVVLYFYPKDDTPGCTVEAKDFRDHLKKFEALGAVVLGVSKDGIKSHERFKEKYCLPFPLLSDESGTVCEAYGTWVEKSMYGKSYMGIQRDTFLIDGSGVIRRIWRRVKVENHVKEVLEAVQKLAG